MLQPKKTAATEVDNIQEDKVWEAYKGPSSPEKTPGSRGVPYQHLQTPDYQVPQMPVFDPEGNEKSIPSLKERLNFVANSATPINEGGGIDRGAETLDFSRADSFVAGDYDNTEAYAIGQGSLSKMANGIGKGLVLTGTTFIQSTVGLVNGVREFAKTGRAASFYDNDFNRALDEINKWSENAMPNYYSHAENDAHWYSPTKLFSANFLWDGIIKNMGFAAGAAASGGVFGGVIKGGSMLAMKALPKAAKLFSMGKAAEALAITEKALFNAGKIGKSGEALGSLTQLADKHIKLYNVLNKAQRITVAGLATTGEAGFEAMHGLNEYRDEAIAEYIEDYGFKPTGEDLAEINDTADNIGNSIFQLNAGLLSATNYIQFPKILGSSYKAEKGLIAGMKKDIHDIVKIDGKFSVKETQKGVKNTLKKIRAPFTYAFSGSEAFEEGAQFAAGVGAKDYYDKKRSGDAHSILDSAFEGVKRTFTTDEGMENILIGGISGAIMLGKGKWQESNQKNKNTSAAVAGLNKRQLSGFSKATMSSIVRGANIQEERSKLVKEGDIFGVENLEADFIINYLAPRIKYGRMDLVNEEIEAYASLAKSEKGWNELISEGKVEPTDTQEEYIARLENLKETAKSMESLYQSISIRYGNMTNEKGETIYSEEIIEKMMYTGSKIDDYNRKMADLAPQIIGVDVQAVVDDIVKGRSKQTVAALEAIDADTTLKAEDKVALKAKITESMSGADVAYEKALAEIDTMDESVLSPEEKTTAKLNLQNIAKMALYRDMFTQEYQAFKERPQDFKDVSTSSSPNPPTEQEKSANKNTAETFTIKTKKGSVEVTKEVEYYAGKIVSYSSQGNERYRAAKFFVLGMNDETGMIRIKDSKGEREISVEEFESLDIGRVDEADGNKKAKFYMDNWNTVYTYNMGKWGGKKTGRLEYSSKANTMIFVWVDKKGKVHRKEVLNKDFKAQKDKKGKLYGQPKIERIGEVKFQSEEERATQEAYFAMKDETRIADKIARRLQTLGDLLTQLHGRQQRTERLIVTKKNAIKDIQKQISELKAPKRGTRGTGPKKFSATMKKLNNTATRLNTLLSDLVLEVDALEADLEEIALTRSETQDLMEHMEDYPDNTKDFVLALKEDQAELELAHTTSAKQLSALFGLIKATQISIDTVIDLIGSMITKFEAKYPNVPRVMGVEWVDFLKANPNFLKVKPNYRADLEYIDAGIAEIEDEQIAASEASLEKLGKQLDDVSDGLKEMEDLLRVKQTILDHFQGTYESYKAEKKQAEVVAKEGKVSDQLDETMDPGEQNDNENTHKYEPSAKKGDKEVRTSTVVPSGLAGGAVNEYVERTQRFAFKFHQLVKDKIFKGVILNHDTYPGLVEGLMGQLYTKVVDDPTDVIVLLITDENGDPVDENGEVITDKANVAEQGIFQVFPGPTLKQYYKTPEGKKLQTMFRDVAPKDRPARAAEIKILEDEYVAWRDKIKAQKELGALENFSPSFGIVDYIKKDTGKTSKGEPVMVRDIEGRSSARTSMQVSNADMKNKSLIIIPTTNDSHTEGSVTYEDTKGKVLLKAAGGMVSLYNKLFNIKEAKTLFDVLHYISKNVVSHDDSTGNQGVQTPEILALFGWLRSTVYYGKPRGKQEAGNSSIYFKTVEVEPNVWEKRLFFGKDSEGILFTPESLATNRVSIESELLKMHHNGQNALLNSKSLKTSYDEVIGVNEDGSTESVEWPNYQTYLLSDKLPIDGKITKDSPTRNVEDIPMSTNVRPLDASNPNDTNRRGMYFTLTTTPEELVIADKVTPEPIVTNTPSKSTKTVKTKGGKTEVKTTTAAPKQGVSDGAVLDGKTVNIISIFGFDIQFRANVEKLAKIAAEHLKLPLNVIASNEDAMTKFSRIIDTDPTAFTFIPGASDELFADLKEKGNPDPQGAVMEIILEKLMSPIVSEAVKEEIKENTDPTKPLTSSVKGIPVLDNHNDNIVRIDGYGRMGYSVNGTRLKNLLRAGADIATTEGRKLIAEFLKKDGDLMIVDAGTTYADVAKTDQYADEAAAKEAVDAVMINVIIKAAQTEIAQEEVAKKVEEVPEGTSTKTAIKNAEAEVAETVGDVDETSEVADEIEDTDDDGWNDAVRKPGEEGDRTVYRGVALAGNEQFSSKVWEKITPWLQANFPNIPVYRVKNSVRALNGRQQWGMFKQGALYVADHSGEGTIYHEVFEAVWKVMADPSEKRAIIKEFRDRKGSYTDRFTGKEIEYSQASDAQLKEELAEEFVDKVLHGKEPKRKSKSLIKRLFQAILDFVNTFHRGEIGANNTKKLFDKIGNGYYKKYNQYASPLSLANIGVQNIEDAVGDADTEYRARVSVIEQHEIIQHMTATIIRDLIKTNKGLFQVTKKLSENNLYGFLYQEIMGNPKTGTNGILRLQGWDYDDQVAKGKMTKEDAAMNNERLRALSREVKASWPVIVEKHKQQLRAFQITFDENENANAEDENVSKIGYLDSNKVDAYKKAGLGIKLLLATQPDTRMVTKTGKNGKTYEESEIIPSSIGGVTFMKSDQVFITLMNELHHSTNVEDMLEKLKALAKSDKGSNYATIYKRLTKQSIADAGILNVDKMTEDDLRLLVGFWQTMKKQNPDVLTVFILSNGDISIGNTDLSSAARASRWEMSNAIIDKIRKGESNFIVKDKKENKYTASATMKAITLDSSDIKSYTDFLEKVGIKFNPKVVESVLKGKPTQMAMFKSAVEGLRKSLASVEGVVNLNTKTMDTAGRLLELGMIEAILENKQFESTYFSLAGERTQTFIGTNHTSTFFDQFSKATKNISQLKDTTLGHLVTDVFTKGSGSLVMNRVFDLDNEGDRVEGTEDIGKPVYIDGTHDAVNNKKTQSSKLSYIQRILQEINLNLEGVFMNLVPGDAELEWGLRLFGKGTEFVNRQDLLKKRHLRVFKDYFIAEVKLAGDNRIIALEKTDETPNNKRNKTDLRFFQDILKDKDEELLLDIEIAIEGKATAESIYTDNAIRINSAVDSYIREETNSTKELLIKYGALEKTSEGYASYGINFGNKDTTDSIMNEQLTLLTINYMIGNIELHKLLYSDPYQYADELKRIKNFNSPRVPLVHGSDVVNEALHRVYNEHFNEMDTGYYDMERDHFRTVVLGDIWSVSEGEDYRDPYEETDGGGLITMQANRVFRLRTSDWTPNHELQYQHDMKYQQIAEDPSKTQKDLDKHEEKNPDVKDVYKPLKPIAAGTKENRRNYNDILLDKYALFPMSFRLLHKFNAESNMLKLNNKMVAENVDYGVYESGRKVGTELVHQIYNKNGSFNDTAFQTPEEAKQEKSGAPNNNSKVGVTHVPFFALGLQTEVPSKDNALVTRGSQFTKLATLDFLQGGVPIDYKPEGIDEADFNGQFAAWVQLTQEQKETVSPLFKEITYNQKILQEQTQDNFENLLDTLGIVETKDGFVIEKREKLVKHLEDEIFKREINDNLIDAFEGFKNNDVIIEATPAYQQIRNVLYSMASKDFVRPKVSGGLKVQVSVAMLESKKAKAVTINGKTTYASDELKFYTQPDGKGGTVNVAEIMIGRWFKSDKTDEQLLDEWYKTDKDGKKTLTAEGKKVLAGVGFRTPTQKQNSTDAFVIKKFLPSEYGDSIILPSEIVKKAGSDFDIDKFSVYLKNVFTNAQGKIMPVPFHGFGQVAKDKFRKYFKDVIRKEIKAEVTSKQFALNNQPKLLRDFYKLISADATDATKKKLGPTMNARIIDTIGPGKNTIEDLEQYFMDRAPSRISKLEGDIKRLTDADIIQVLEDEYVKKMYKESLQNEYVDSLFKLVSHPDNYENLVKPNSAQTLKVLSKEIYQTLLGNEETDYSSPGFMLSRKRMSGLRQAFVSGKQAISIAAVGQTNHSQNQRAPIIVDPALVKSIKITETDRRWLGDGTVNFEKFNTIQVLGKILPTLSMAKNAAGEYISDIIGMFIDGYVDISKGPWIMEMGATPQTAGTWLYLIKLGVPIDTVAYFMNQPSVLELIKQADIQGMRGLHSKNIVEGVLESYVNDKEVSEITKIPSETSLKEMVGKPQHELTPLQNSQQKYILMEFLKYAKMADQLYLVTQGTNHDTASLNDPLLIFKKFEQNLVAQETIFSSMKVEDDGTQTQISAADALMENSFIGNLSETLKMWRDAAATALISDKPEVRRVLETLLRPYVGLNDRDFVTIAQRAVESLFDWAVQTQGVEKTNQGFSEELDKLLVGEESSVQKILEFKEEIAENPKHPLHGNMLLEALTLERGTRDGTVDNLRITGRDNKAVYDQNQLINSFKEIDDYLKNNEQEDQTIYPRLVSIAVMQSGLTTSPISFSKLLPYEDFKEQYNATLSNLETLSNLDDFLDTKAFQRNNWSNVLVVPTIKAEFKQNFATGKYFNPATVNNSNLLKVEYTNGNLPKTLFIWEGTIGAHKDIITYTYTDKLEHRTDLSKDEIKRRREKGDTRATTKLLMQKVYREDGTPLKHTKKYQGGSTEGFIYKQINAWGDSYKAQEYYDYDTYQEGEVSVKVIPASKIDNDYIKVLTGEKSSYERSDQEVVSVYEGGSVVGEKAKAKAETYQLPMSAVNIKKIHDGIKTLSISKTRIKDGVHALSDGSSITIKALGIAKVEYVGDSALVSTNGGTQTWGAQDFARKLGEESFETFADATSKYTEFADGNTEAFVYSIIPVPNGPVAATAIKTEDTNVYFKGGDNKILSNLAKRPFVYKTKQYQSVEHAYQTLKSGNFDQKTYDRPQDFVDQKKNAPTKVNKSMNLVLMEALMLASFSASPRGMVRLFETGMSRITHNGVNDKFWKEHFPDLLMKVRKTLALSNEDPTWKDKKNPCNPI